MLDFFAIEINADCAKKSEDRALNRLAGKFEGEVLQRERVEASLERTWARTWVAAGH